jgi:multimeric flavodoxin WrbA
MKTILFVCEANTCRSPMAAALINRFRHPGIQAISAGTTAFWNDGILPVACDVLTFAATTPNANNDYRNHLSHPLQQTDFENADLIVFSSPVYNGGFSSPLKALIDRFQFYYTSFYKNGKVQPITKKRNGILLVSAGRSGTAALQTMEKDLSCAFTILNMELTGSALCAFTDTEPTYGEALKQLKMILKRSLSDE